MYTIIKPNNNNKFIFISKDNNIIYIQLDYFHGYNITTVNKPNRDLGTGSQLEQRETDLEKIENNLDNYLKQDYPHFIYNQYASKLDLKSYKYRTLDSFLKEHKDYTVIENLSKKDIINHITQLQR